MIPRLREAASRVTARVVGSRFAKPIARVVLVAAGLLLLAFVGKTAVAGALGSASAPVGTSAVQPSPVAPVAVAASALVPTAPPPVPTAVNAPPPEVATGTVPASHTQATPDDPVFLNTAGVDDLRRLPGIGEKRATALLALRTRLGGRFHAIEDLLKVKGIGRTTLRRLRPLVRLDPPPAPPPPASASAPEPGHP
jgi:competence protein ComEA